MVVNQLRQELDGRSLGNRDLVVFGAEVLSDPPSLFSLIDARLTLETYRKRPRNHALDL